MMKKMNPIRVKLEKKKPPPLAAGAWDDDAPVAEVKPAKVAKGKKKLKPVKPAKVEAEPVEVNVRLPVATKKSVRPPADDGIQPPDWLEDEARALFFKKRDEVNGNIPTPGDVDMLAQLCNAEFQMTASAANVARLGNSNGKHTEHAQRLNAYWFEQHRKLMNKCKFLRSKKLAAAPVRNNKWTRLLSIDETLIDDTKFKSEFVDKATQYVTDVLSGKIPACRQLRRACERQKKDMAKNWDFKYSRYLAHRACEFISNLPHVKGKWAKHKELLKLEPWECFLICTLFGWVKKSNNLRRFRKTYWAICRKNGKSVLAAAIGLFMLLGDGEHGAEVYSGATTEKQAWEVFRPARLMLLNTPELVAASGATVNAGSLAVEQDGSRFETIIGNPGDGASPSCAIIDEFHEHDTPNQFDTMETGTLAREQSILMVITTAGYNFGGPCYEMQTKAEQVLDGVLEDDSLFVCIYTIDLPNEATGEKGDDWTDPKALAKANPNLGVSVDLDTLMASQRSAALNASEQNKFKTKHLNLWCTSRKAWLNMQVWMAMGDTELEAHELAGEPCVFSFDLASKLDISAYMKIFRKTMGEQHHYYVFGKFYLPEDRLNDEGKNQHLYKKWHAQGILTITDGATTDFDRIKNDMIEDAKVFNPEEVVYDPFNATHISQLLMDEGLTLVEFVQQPKNFAVPMDEIEAALKGARLHHDNNGLMNWMISNVKTAPAKKGLFWPTKETNDQKIDGPVAMIMGISRSMTGEESSGLDDFLKDAVHA